MRSRSLGGLIAGILVAGAIGCSGAAPKLPGSNAGEAVTTGKAAEWIKKGDEAWKQRHVEARLREANDAYVKAFQLAPENKDALVRLAQTHFYLGERFTDDAEKKEELHANGMQYAILAVLLNPQVREKMDFLADRTATPLAKRKHMGEVVALADKDDAEALYWLGVNWGRWGELRGIVRQSMDIPKVFKVMEKTLDLIPDYHGAGPHRFFGAYYEAIPAMSGKDLNKSREHFDKAIQIAPKMLANKVLYAQYYARGADDEALYDRMLKEVLDASDALEPQWQIDNDQAKRKAKELVDTKDEVF